MSMGLKGWCRSGLTWRLDPAGDGKATVGIRRGHDWSHSLTSITAAAATLSCRSALEASCERHPLVLPDLRRPAALAGGFQLADDVAAVARRRSAPLSQCLRSARAATVDRTAVEHDLPGFAHRAPSRQFSAWLKTHPEPIKFAVAFGWDADIRLTKATPQKPEARFGGGDVLRRLAPDRNRPRRPAVDRRRVPLARGPVADPREARDIRHAGHAPPRSFI
jgi:hypothetical protein